MKNNPKSPLKLPLKAVDKICMIVLTKQLNQHQIALLNEAISQKKKRIGFAYSGANSLLRNTNKNIDVKTLLYICTKLWLKWLKAPLKELIRSPCWCHQKQKGRYCCLRASQCQNLENKHWVEFHCLKSMLQSVTNRFDWGQTRTSATISSESECHRASLRFDTRYSPLDRQEYVVALQKDI